MSHIVSIMAMLDALKQRRTWLRAALEFLSNSESEIDRLKACTEILKKSEIKRNDRNINVYANSDEDKKLVSNALEEIIEIIDQIDNARGNDTFLHPWGNMCSNVVRVNATESSMTYFA